MVPEAWSAARDVDVSRPKVLGVKVRLVGVRWCETCRRASSLKPYEVHGAPSACETLRQEIWSFSIIATDVPDRSASHTTFGQTTKPASKALAGRRFELRGKPGILPKLQRSLRALAVDLIGLEGKQRSGPVAGRAIDAAEAMRDVCNISRDEAGSPAA